MKMNSCILKAILTSVPLFCILKPFPSVFLKGIFLNKTYFFSMCTNNTFYHVFILLNKYQLGLLLWL